MNEQENQSVQPAPQPETQPASSADAVSQGGVAVAQSPIPQNSKKPLMIVVALLVVALLAVAGIILLITGQKKPREVVEEAFAATMAQQEIVNRQIFAQYPVLDPNLQATLGDVLQSDFALTLQKLDGMPNAALLQAMLSGSGISGHAVVDMNTLANQLDLQISLKGKQLLEGSVFLSPEQMAFSVPELSQTHLSVPLDTIAQDYRNSAFYDPENPYMELMLEQLAASIQGQLEYVRAISTLSVEQLTEDTKNLFVPVLQQAEYSFDKTDKTYVVTLQGEAVRQAALDFYAYIYRDSQIADAMRSMMDPMITQLEEYEDYDAFVDDLLDELATQIPQLDTVIKLHIEKDLIAAADFLITPIPTAEQQEQEILLIEPITANLQLSADGRNATIFCDVPMADNGALQLTCDTAYTDAQYVTTVDMRMDVQGQTMALPLTLTFTPDGGVKLDCTVEMADMFNFSMTADGSTLLEGTTLKNDYPNTTFSAMLDGTLYGVTVDYSDTTSPAEHPPVLQLPVTSLFSMSQAELTALMTEAQENYQGLMGRIFSSLLG